MFTAAPLKESLVLFTLVDVSGDQRRKALERVFFHDVLNTAAGVEALAAILGKTGGSGQGATAARLSQCAKQLIAEIHQQKMLSDAEANELRVTPKLVRSADLLDALVAQYRNHPEAHGRTLSIAASSEDLSVVTDPVLFSRVLGNLVKNALEAVDPGETVTIGCQSVDDLVEFWVHNPGHMRRELQLQVFQRSFSTKGIGRGLGTYSIKLLSEVYLAGLVGFTSTVATGTRFFARYPSRHPAATLDPTMPVP